MAASSKMSISDQMQSASMRAGGIGGNVSGGGRASIVQKQAVSFSESFLLDCFPFESYREQVIATCNELALMGLLHVRTKAALAGSSSKPEVVYTFAVSALADTVRLRMLQKRKTQVVKSVQRVIEQRADFAKRTYLDKMMDSSSKMGGAAAQGSFGKKGMLYVRKNVEEKGSGLFSFRSGKGAWKQRAIELLREEVRMYRSDGESGTGNDPLGVIKLADASATEVPATDDMVYQFTFRVDCKSWIKKG